jgi:hypothetical protein
MLEFDPKTSHYYFFNARTGESRWAEEADFLTGLGGQQVEQQVCCVAFGVVVDVSGQRCTPSINDNDDDNNRINRR